MRSLLIVADTAAIDAAMSSGADAVVLDVGALDQDVAAGILAYVRPATLWLLLGPVDGERLGGDLDALVRFHPAGVLLAGAAGDADVMRVSAMIAAREALAGLDDGALRIIAAAAETPAGLFGLGTYAGASGRLAGLAVATGAPSPVPAGSLAVARALCLAAAAAANVVAIDAPSAGTDIEDDCRRARADGFGAKLTRDPAEVAAINRAFG